MPQVKMMRLDVAVETNNWLALWKITSNVTLIHVPILQSL